VESAAFEKVFEDQFDAIYGYLARRVGPDVGRELAAEAFTRAIAARKKFDPLRGEARAWLFGIAANLLRRHYRDEERRLRALARLDLPFVAEEPQEPHEPRVAAALAEMPRIERDALLLFAWADLTYDEIAVALDIPVGTVRSRIHRARQRMREALAEEEALDG
jgi:RNA polymerase sigma factor (sigma-70 family)